MSRPQHENNFDFARFLAASLVLISHHYPLSGKAEPIVPGFNNTLGGVAVSIFFIMSGYLIFQSLTRSNDVGVFIAARLLRIVPNLALSAAISSLLMLIWFANYNNISAHFTYFIKNSISFIQPPIYGIPGILEGQPNESINGSLWTLQYEILMYLLLFMTFTLRKEITILLILIFLLIFYKIEISKTHEMIKLVTFKLDIYYTGLLGFFFFSGAIIAALWNKLKLHPLLICSTSLIILSLLLLANKSGTPIIYFLFSILLIFFCNSKSLSKFSRGGDASYGIYIYAFPIQQLAIITIPSFWGSMAVSFIITILIGYAVWHTIEKHSLKYRIPLSKRISSFLRK